MSVSFDESHTQIYKDVELGSMICRLIDLCLQQGRRGEASRRLNNILGLLSSLQSRLAPEYLPTLSTAVICKSSGQHS